MNSKGVMFHAKNIDNAYKSFLNVLFVINLSFLQNYTSNFFQIKNINLGWDTKLEKKY
jgi:hypothetical protein